MANIEKAFKQVYPTESFQYSVFKVEIMKFYSEEQRLSTLINAAMLGRYRRGNPILLIRQFLVLVIFASAGPAAIILVLVTVAFHAIRAAVANPVTAL